MATENQKHPTDRLAALAEFDQAPDSALFNEACISQIRDCSKATLQRDRWAGGGISYLKIGRAVRYRKADVLAWLEKYQPQQSTSANHQG